MRFSGQKVLLTGGSGGLGRHVWRLLTERGADVTLVGRSPPAEAGTSFIAADLSTAEGLEAAAAAAASQPWDVLINLAGVQYFGPFESQAGDDVLRAYMINLVAPARLIQAVLPGMKSRGHGWIANVGSIFGSINFAHFASYSSTKAGLRGLSQALRRELAHSGVGVTYIAPRAIRTPMNSADVHRFAAQTSMKMDDPAAIAARIVAAIESERADVYLGFPEALFVRINALAPSLVDRALRAKDLKARALFHPDRLMEKKP